MQQLGRYEECQIQPPIREKRKHAEENPEESLSPALRSAFYGLQTNPQVHIKKLKANRNDPPPDEISRRVSVYLNRPEIDIEEFFSFIKFQPGFFCSDRFAQSEISSPIQSLRKYIDTCPGILEQTDSFGDTLLHAILGHKIQFSEEATELITTVIQKMSTEKINSYNRRKQHGYKEFETPLHRCCTNVFVSPAIVASLLKAGANPLLTSFNKLPLEKIDETIAKSYDQNGIVQYNLSAVGEMLAEATNAREYERPLFRPSILARPDTLSEFDRLFYWSERAVRYVQSVGVIGAPNHENTVKRTGGWSVRVADVRLQPEVTPFFDWAYALALNESPDYDPDELVVGISLVRAKALYSNRGGGDCFVQASLAFCYLYNRGIRVEHFKMDDGGSHQFVVVGRDRASDPGKPETWGPLAIICDPWTGSCIPASRWHETFEHGQVRKGSPMLQYNEETIDNMSEKMRAILAKEGIELIPNDNPQSERRYTIRFKTPVLTDEEQAFKRELFAAVHSELRKFFAEPFHNSP